MSCNSLLMLRIARALFFTGVAWVLPSAALAWLFAGMGMPLQVPLGLAISTLLILCGLVLGRAQGAMMLRWSALFIGIATLAIGLAHNVIAMNPLLPNLSRRSFQAADSAAALSGFVLIGISIAVCGLLLCILVARLERDDATARLVALVLALYYLMAGTLTGVLVVPLTETWAPVWLAFGVWLLGALVCSAPAKADRPKS